MSQVESAVSMRGVTKTFPGVIANADVSIDFHKGEIHALLGENGAGKSTLMNVLTGIYRQNGGEIFVDGKKAEFNKAADAIDAGIGMVHQHFKLVKAFTVAQNLHMGWAKTPAWISDAQLNQSAGEIAEEFGFGITPEAYIDELSAGAQQRVEILRVLARGTQVLIVDEPTAVLTPPEVESLFKVLRALKASGRTIIFISHKLDEVLDISDRVTVLRGGKVVATHESKDMTTQSLANLMVGRDVLFERMDRHHASDAERHEVLRLEDVSAVHENGAAALTKVNLSISAFEILGVAGVAGNGQRALSEVIAGVRPVKTGKVKINAHDIAKLGADDVAELGVGHIPEDRLKSGFAGDLPVSANAVLRAYKEEPVSSGIWYHEGAAVALAEQMVAEAEVSTPDVHVPLRNLSGGNQQRLIAERECQIADQLLVAVYPMRGLDVGAVERLRAMIMERRNAGAAVILVSEELDELLELSDRIAVLNHGRIVGTLDVEDATLERIGLMMGGEEVEVNN